VSEIPIVKLEERVGEPLTREEVKKLLETSDSLRNKLIVSFIYYLGLEVEDVTNIKLHHLDRDNREVRIVRNGEETRTVSYPPELDKPIKQFLKKDRKGYCSAHRESLHLFPSKWGKSATANGLTPSQVHDIINRLATKAGIQETIEKTEDGEEAYRVNPTALRYSFTKHALEETRRKGFFGGDPYER